MQGPRPDRAVPLADEERHHQLKSASAGPPIPHSALARFHQAPGGRQSGRWSGCLKRPPILAPSIEIAGALGQTHASSAAPYVIEAEQKRSAKRVMKALERSGRR
jgi:hypothetical protein